MNTQSKPFYVYKFTSVATNLFLSHALFDEIALLLTYLHQKWQWDTIKTTFEELEYYSYSLSVIFDSRNVKMIIAIAAVSTPVSYTHLTLPTIYSV